MIYKFTECRQNRRMFSTEKCFFPQQENTDDSVERNARLSKNCHLCCFKQVAEYNREDSEPGMPGGIHSTKVVGTTGRSDQLAHLGNDVVK